MESNNKKEIPTLILTMYIITTSLVLIDAFNMLWKSPLMWNEYSMLSLCTATMLYLSLNEKDINTESPEAWTAKILFAINSLTTLAYLIGTMGWALK